MNYPDDFEKAFAFVLEHEKGYVNNPKDPGGETKYGICKKYHPNLDIKNLTVEQAKEIYYNEYWPSHHLNSTIWAKLSYGEKLMIFDCWVNQGQSFAMSIMAYSLMGMALSRINRYFDLTEQNSNLVENFHGWCRRVFDCLAAGENIDDGKPENNSYGGRTNYGIIARAFDDLEAGEK